jgi:hypothetical protein
MSNPLMSCLNGLSSFANDSLAKFPSRDAALNAHTAPECPYSCLVRGSVAGSIRRPGRSNLGDELAPRLHPVFYSFEPDDRTGPATMAMRIEKVGIRILQILFVARAG